MKKLGVFFILALCMLGSIGGIGYVIHYGERPANYVIAAGIVVLSLVAWPRFSKLMKELWP